MPRIPHAGPESPPRPATPRHGPDPAEGAARRHRLGLDRISLRRHDKDPAEIYKAIFGKEPVVDEHTGAFVVPARPG